MKAQDVVRRDTIRLCLAALHNEQVARRGPLDQDAELAILGRQARMRRESIEAFDRGGRAELAARERAELVVLEGYLPAQLGDDEIRAVVARVIADTGASGPKAQGQVMQKVMAELRGNAPGARVAGLVAAALAGDRAGTGQSEPAP